jgi:short-subunit dehydrogenase
MKPGKPIALITGASSGIGAAFAQVFAAQGHDLVLVARREDRLRALASAIETQSEVHCHVVVQDLGLPEAPQAVLDDVVRRGLQVGVLVNNAGVLHRGTFAATGLAQHLQLLQLNVVACTALAHLFLAPMLARGSGRILNVASMSAFQPLPHLAVYAASKAYLLSLSEALAIETRGTGVTVTALCPGFTNTDMIARDAGESAMHLPFVRNLEPDEVARQGYVACMAGQPLLITGAANRAVAAFVRHQPRSWWRWASSRVARKGF